MSKHTNQQGSAHLIVIICLVLALLTALGWIFYQNFLVGDTMKKETNTGVVDKDKADNAEDKDVYAGWMTYTSENHNYSLKHPADWTVIPEAEGDGLLYLRNFDPASKPDGPRDGNTQYPKGYMNMQVSVMENDINFKNAHGLTTTEWYNKLGESAVSGGATSIRPEDVTNKALPIGTTTGKVVKSVFTETNEDIYILTSDGTIYLLSLYPYGSSSDKTVKLILDTFDISK